MGEGEEVAQQVAWIYKRPNYASDVVDAFTRLGWHAEQMDEVSMMRRMAAGEKPTLVLMNKAGKRMGYVDPPDTTTVLEMTEERGIPFVWWLFDSWFHSPDLVGLDQQATALGIGFPPVMPMEIPDGKHLWCFSVNRSNLHRLKGQCQVYLPFGVNERRFKPLGTHQVHPVGFVGTSLIGCHTDGVSMLEAAGVWPKVAAGIDVHDKPTADTWRILCDVRLSAIDRVQACEAVGAHVWGENWEQVENIHKHGPCSFEELPGVMNSCGIGLNISKRCFPDDVAPRVLELLACGSVVVSNRLPGLEKEFGDVLHFYDSTPELQELVAKVTVDPALRVSRGREIVEAAWTWEHRVKEICRVIGI